MKNTYYFLGYACTCMNYGCTNMKMICFYIDIPCIVKKYIMLGTAQYAL